MKTEDLYIAVDRYNVLLTSFIRKELKLSGNSHIKELSVTDIRALFDERNVVARDVIFSHSQTAGRFYARLGLFHVYLKTIFPKEFFEIREERFIEGFMEYGYQEEFIKRELEEHPLLQVLFDVITIVNVMNF